VEQAQRFAQVMLKLLAIDGRTRPGEKAVIVEDRVELGEFFGFHA